MGSLSYQTDWEVTENRLQSRPDINPCTYTSFDVTAIYQPSYREQLVQHDRVICATANFISWPSSLCIPNICSASDFDNRNHTQTLQFLREAQQYSSTQHHSDKIHVNQTGYQATWSNIFSLRSYSQKLNLYLEVLLVVK